MTRLFRIVVTVSDIEAATAFYENALRVKGIRISKGRHHFNTGSCILACYDPLTEGDEMGKGWMLHKNHYIYFSVTNLESTFLRLKNSDCQEIDRDITQSASGERFFNARDPFGNPICFVDEKTISRE